MFAACQMRSCVDVSIVDDVVQENVESFNISMKRTPDLDSRIVLHPANGVVKITDNDGRYTYTTIRRW